MAADDKSLDLVGALEDLGDLGLPEPAFGREILRVSGAAEDLHRIGRHPHGGIRGDQFRDRSGLADGATGVAQPRGIQVGGAGGAHRGLHVGQQESQPLIGGDRATELLALAGIGDGQVEGALSEPRGRRGDAEPAGVEGGEGDRLLTIVRTDTRPAPDTNPVWREVAAAVAGGAPADRGTLAQVAAVLDRADVDLTAVNDVEWDMIVGIEPAGVEEVFDATVLGTHNFVANGVVVHNSIEQDADMVMLLHRESVYEQDSPREGEADIIVAKHRNGPTKTITVAFQGHYSRFTNMATNF